MGSGIAQVAAQAGFVTIQFDVDRSMLAKSKTVIESALEKLVSRDKMTEGERSQVLSRMSFTDRIDDCEADLVIEAIVENKQAKIDLFRKLASCNSPDTIFATNTSSLSVSEIADALEAPSNVAGMHFFNPAPVMKLVEIVQGQSSSGETVDTLLAVAKRMGKTAVVCKDAPGFIVNRVARPYYLEALKLVEDGLADIETIDAVMEANGFKMGPFRLMDLIGIDINYSVSSIVWEALGKPERLQPSSIQASKITKGEKGRKTGRGFYEY